MMCVAYNALVTCLVTTFCVREHARHSLLNFWSKPCLEQREWRGSMGQMTLVASMWLGMQEGGFFFKRFQHE
jgi:hypothetical protein